MKELGRKTGVLVGLDLPLRVGELKQGFGPHCRAVVWVRGETFKAESETADLWQPKWNENQTVFAKAIHMPGRNRGLLEGAVARSWSLRLWCNPRSRATVVHRETDWGDVREEIVVGNAWGGKPGSHGSKVILLSHTWRMETSPWPLSTCQHQQLNNREPGPSNAWHAELQSRTPPRVSL